MSWSIGQFYHSFIAMNFIVLINWKVAESQELPHLVTKLFSRFIQGEPKVVYFSMAIGKFNIEIVGFLGKVLLVHPIL